MQRAQHHARSQPGRGRAARAVARAALGSLLAVLLFSAPEQASAMCDVIPQPDTVFRGETGSLNRVFASPGDPVRVAIDPTGCDVGSAGFATGTVGSELETFDDGLAGWSNGGGAVIILNITGNPAPAIGGQDSGSPVATVLAPAEFLGDWTTRGVTQMRWDHWVNAGTGSNPLLSGDQDMLRLSGPGGSAVWRVSQAFIDAQLDPSTWGSFSVDIDTAQATGDWVVTSGSWVALMSDVTQLSIQGELGQASGLFGFDQFQLDNIELVAAGATGSVMTLLFEPPAGPASAVVVPMTGGTCTGLASDLAACQVELSGGSVSCRDDLSPDVTSDSLLFSMPDEGLAGPVTIAVSEQGEALPCSLAATRCGGPGAPAGLLACIDTIYASDGTCEADAANRHPQFPGLTALPARNDFEGICDSSNPSIPCNNSGVDVQFTTDAAGNLVIPIDWRGVLVPGTLPIPRLVRATSSAAAFTGVPPEPSQTPGAPIEVPGLRFLQSFSQKGLRVDPLFNPLFSEDAASETELFGSVDAELGVVRVLRRSPAFRECAGGDRAALACIADFECPASSCAQASCRGGANDGNACAGDAQCPGGECGSSLFDFSDRYSNGGTGPVLLTSAEYDAEALNPVAIDGLAATDQLFSFVRSEPLENLDINNDGDATDDTIVVLQNAKDGAPADIARNVGGSGRASARVRNGLFRFPPLSVENGIATFLEAEAWELGIPLNGDSDSLDALLRVYDLEVEPAAELTAGMELPVSTLPAVNDRSVVVSDGLVFFRESEPANSRWFFSFQAIQTGGIFAGDPRWLVYQNDDDGLCNPSQVRVLDRDSDLDGLYDEGSGPETAVSVDAAGTPTNGWAFPRAISGTGRFVLFDSNGTDLQAPPPADGNAHAFLHDRDLDEDGIFDEPGQIETIWVDQGQGGRTCIGSIGQNPVGIAVSDDGRWVTYLTGGVFWILNRDADGNGIFGDRVSFPFTDLLPVAGAVSVGAVTPDARFVAFGSAINGLVAGDSNDALDWFVLDRDADEDGILDEPGATSVVSPSRLTSGFPPAGPNTRVLDLSDDGRVLLVQESLQFLTYDRDGDGDGWFDEPGTVIRERMPLAETGDDADTANLSGDGRWVFLGPDGGPARPFRLDRTTLVYDSPFNSVQDLWDTISFDISRQGDAVVGYDFTDGGSARVWTQRLDASTAVDRNADGDERDFLLAVGDATQGPSLVVSYLGAADQVSVSAGNAAFLQPEAAIGPGGTDLNGDLDSDDAVVHLYRNRQPPAVNLGRAATAVAVSDQQVAALVSEAGQGLVLNGDGDQQDTVVQVNDLATGTSGTWTNLAIAGDAVQAVGPYVAFTVPEWSQGASLNGDGDQDDRVLRVWDAQAAGYVDFADEFGTPIPGLAVDDFVLGDSVVAFRVNEFDQGVNLNGVAPPIPGGVADGDLFDSVMHVADLATGTVYNSTQAAVPCPVEACDPRIPYRVQGRKVTHLTLEGEQGGNDLDQNGDGGTGLVLQHFNIDSLLAGGTMQDACDVLGGALAGICTNTAEACASDADCGGAVCYFPPGGCLLDLATQCDTNPDDAFNLGECAADEICVPAPGLPGEGSCHAFQGPCLDDGQCTGGAFCTDNGADPEQLFAAVGDEPDGRQRFVSQGRCSDGDGSCATSADCNAGASCDGDMTVIATAADPDADGLADPIDNCDDVANSDQLDLDQDGIGDACDRQSCGNAVQEYGEGCDHGAQNGLDGVCAADCSYVGIVTACSDGIDNDGDGGIDLADPGCTDGADTSERSDALACDDGRDNDGDYASDFPADPGCASASSISEAPECNDGIDNDADGFTDFPADPQCSTGSDLVEVPEPAALLQLAAGAALLWGLARRRRRGRPHGGAVAAGRS